MKRIDDSTKKLIKNVASLVTSALVLIAATIAWFTSGGNAAAGPLRGNVVGRSLEVHYYRLQNTYLDANGLFLNDVYIGSRCTGDGLTAFNIFSSGNLTNVYPAIANPAKSGTQNMIDTLMDAEVTETVVNNGTPESTSVSAWEETNNWNISSLFPGVFNVFRLTTPSGVVPRHVVIKGISCTDSSGNNTLTAQQKEMIYQNTYLYALAFAKVKTETANPSDPENPDVTYSYEVLQNNSSPVADCIQCNSLEQLLDSNNNSVDLSNIGATQSITGEIQDYSVMIFVGVPGNSVETTDTTVTPSTVTTDNLRNTHDLLRQIGAQIGFTEVSVE